MNTFIRLRVPRETYKRFKIHCMKLEANPGKQMAELIRKFVEIQDENERLMGK